MAHRDTVQAVTKRNVLVALYLTEEEAEWLRINAWDRNTSLSGFMRTALRARFVEDPRPYSDTPQYRDLFRGPGGSRAVVKAKFEMIASGVPSATITGSRLAGTPSGVPRVVDEESPMYADPEEKKK